MADHGEAGLSAFRNAYPELSTSSYDPARFDAEQVVEDADLVIVHGWTDPAIVAALGALRKRRGAMTLLFPDRSEEGRVGKSVSLRVEQGGGGRIEQKSKISETDGTRVIKNTRKK